MEAFLAIGIIYMLFKLISVVLDVMTSIIIGAAKGLAFLAIVATVIIFVQTQGLIQ